MNTSWQKITLGVLLPLSAGFGSGALFERYVQSTHMTSDDIEISDVSIKKLETVKSMLEQKFVDPEKITPEKLEEWMIRGILYSVEDPYTEYFNEEQSEEFEKDMQGDFEGVGAALEKQKEKVVITEVMSGRPAAQAGLLPGDIIISVDDKKPDHETIYETVNRIRGPKGTPVHLEIYRDGEIKKYTITRANIHVESVTLTWKNDIAVIEVTQFGDSLENEFKKAFIEVDKKKPKGIIIDMRYNGGGYLDGAVALSSYFLPSNTTVVSLKEKDGIADVSKTKSSPFNDTTTPMIVLINGGSASAAEIFSGALQDHKRAKLVGEKSFGKGVVQEIFPLDFQKDEMVKITIAKWYTPNGKTLTNEDALIPDVIVEWDKSKMTEEQKANKYDPQLEKAIELLTL